MAVLKDILYKVSLVSVSGDTQKEVALITMDSRSVSADSLVCGY